MESLKREVLRRGVPPVEQTEERPRVAVRRKGMLSDVEPKRRIPNSFGQKPGMLWGDK